MAYEEAPEVEMGSEGVNGRDVSIIRAAGIAVDGAQNEETKPIPAYDVASFPSLDEFWSD